MNSPNAQHKETPARLPEPNATELGEGSQALTEAVAFATGTDLSSRQETNEINRLIRGDKAEQHVHRILIVGAWVVAIGVFGCFAVIVWHKTMPESWRFLKETQIKEIYEFLFTGLLGGLLTKGGERLISR